MGKTDRIEERERMGRKRHLLRRRRTSLSLAENHSSRSLLLGRSGTTCCCRRIGMDDAPPIWAINETNHQRSEEDTFDVHTKERVGGGPSKHMHSGEVVCCEVAHKGEG